MTYWQNLVTDASIDTGAIRATTRFRKIELRFRLPFVVFAAIVPLLGFGLTEPAIMFAAWSVLYLITSVWTARLPKYIGRFALGFYVIVIFLDAALYNAVAMFFWFQDDHVFHLFAFATVATAMVSTTFVRAGSSLLWVTDCLALAVVFMSGPLIAMFQGSSPPEVVLEFILLGIIFSYFWALLYWVGRMRVNARRSKAVEIERAKSDAVGKLAGGMAHDFNNLLTVVLGNLELARLSPRPGERGELLDAAEDAARRGVALISHLLAFSRKARLETQDVSVAEILAGVSPLITPILRNKHQMRYAPLPDLPDLRVDMGKIQSVLLELVLNARDAMPGGGEIRFEAWKNRHQGRAWVVMAVEDQGEGIPPDKLGLIWDPFFTTKQGSTGLGLSMVKGIVEQSGGRIEVLSMSGKGTRMMLHLPASDGSAVLVD